jgi:micrococcal nuclease
MNTLNAPTATPVTSGARAGCWRALLVCALAAALAGAVGVLAPLPAQAQAQRAAAPVEGVVERVVDGDSLWFRPAEGEPIELRLKDIDAPERCQSGGEAAREALRERVEGRVLTLRVTGRDRFGRTLGRLHDGTHDIGTRMVAEGHAWSVRTRWDQGPLVAQERMARALRRGLHADAAPVPPWDFRRAGGCGAAEAAASGTAASAASAGTPPPATGRPTQGDETRGSATVARPAAAAPTASSGPAARPPLLAERGVIALSAARAVADDSATGASRFRCDGRRYCSEMRSCEEAQFLLRHCPAVRMDGNRDGVPCERQWCGATRR